MKVLHILYQSLPQVSGSSIRSRDILMSQNEIGLNVVALTSSFQGSLEGRKEDIIDGIRYIRTTSKKTTTISDQKKNKLSQFSRIFGLIPFTFKLFNIVSSEKPDILHAHAMFYCGIPAIFVGKIKNIPVVYEFRSLWMFQKKKGLKNKLDVFLENALLSIESYTLKKADYAVFLNRGLQEFFSKKNIKFKKAAIINNAVNTAYIDIQKRKFQSQTERTELVFGYIGTLTSYEGIEFLVETFQELHEEGLSLKLLIYGDGISKNKVVELINSKSNINSISYKGRVKPREVAKAFAELDVIVNPRLSNRVTNSVTPLKPLEAFAYQKLFLGSDVSGITALVEHKITGFLFKAEDKQSLKNEIKKIIKLPVSKRKLISENALQFVLKEKSWKNNALKYQSIYASLLSEN